MKLKKRLAVLLTAAMVMGMTVPAGATTLSTNEVPGSDSRTGHGDKEAHLDREVANIILPVISENAFDFTVDPERLVQATGGARFEAAGQKVETTAMDDGVFFQVSDNKYDSKTPEFDFENKSSFAIDLTVEVEAEHNVEATDLELLSANEVTVDPAPVAGLYLGLKVGDDLSAATAKPILYDAPAKTTISVNGVDRNFTVSWNSTEGYHNVEKDTLVDTWKHGKFQIEGIATKGKEIADETSAPSIKVTWSWKKYGEVEYFDSHSISASSPSVGMTLPDGVSISSVTLYKAANPTTPVELVAGTTYTATTTSLSLKTEHITAWGAGSKLKVKFSNNKTETINIQ